MASKNNELDGIEIRKEDFLAFIRTVLVGLL